MSRVRKEGMNEDGSNEEESGGGGSSSEEEGGEGGGEGVRCGVERDGADDNDEDNDEDNDGDDEENDDNDEENDGDDDNDSVNSSSSSEVSVLDANSSVVLDLPPLTTHNNTTNSTPSEVSSSSTEETLDQENEREKYIPEALREAVLKRNNLSNLEADGWTTKKSESEYIGKCVRRYFPGFGLADGAVVAHLTAEDNDGHPLWHVVHEDGDSEDISEDDYELCHEMFVKDENSESGLRRQKHPPGPVVEGYSSEDSVKQSSQQRRKNKKSQDKGETSDAGPTEHHKTISLGHKTAEYILQESYDEKEIREGEEYQVDEINIPEATPYVDSPAQEINSMTGVKGKVNAHDYENMENFLRWAKRQFLQPGMVAMAYVSTAKVVLASNYNAPSSSSAINTSDDGINLEPVLHYAQRYVVVMTYLESLSEEDFDTVVVFDGITHHKVKVNLCTIIRPILVSNLKTLNVGDESCDAVKCIDLVEIWVDNVDPKCRVLDLCKEIKENLVTEEGIDIFLSLWRAHKQSLVRYSTSMRHFGIDHKQVMGFYHILLPFLCTTPVDRVCLQLRGIHRVVDLLNGRSPYLPGGYSNLSDNHAVITSGDACSMTSTITLSREMDGDFGENSDSEDVFVPKFVIPRKQFFLPPPVRRQASSSAIKPPGGGIRKVEKYDLATGEVLAVYDSQSKAALEDEGGVTQSQISGWCRGTFSNSKKEFTFGYRFRDEKEEEGDEKTEVDESDKKQSDDKSSDVKQKLSSTHEEVRYSYELDNGRFTIDEGGGLFPTYSSRSQHRGASRRQRNVDRHPSCIPTEDINKKSIARQAAAKYYGFSDRQEAVRAAERERMVHNGGYQKKRHRAGVTGHRKKAVEQFDYETGVTIQTFVSGSEAARILKLSPNTVSCICTGRMHSVQGWGFRFTNEHAQSVPKKAKQESATQSTVKRRRSGPRGNKKSVEQFDISTGETIEVFSSGLQAAKHLGLQQTSISQCCLGRKSSIGDFGFRFQGGDGGADNGVASDSDSENEDSKAGVYQRKSLQRSDSNVKRVGGVVGGKAKIIEQYDLATGEHIETYPSMKDCAREAGYNRNSISLCCSGRQRSLNNYGFRFVNEGDDYDHPALEKAVEQFSIDSGETIKEFKGCTEAAAALNIKKATINMCCVGRQSQVDDFGFRFADPVEREKIEMIRTLNTQHKISFGGVKGRKGKPVEQFCLETGNTLQTFPSGSAAASALGVHKMHVSMCCAGKRRGLEDYSFRFADEGDDDSLPAPNSSNHNHQRPQLAVDIKEVELFDMITGDMLQFYPSTTNAADILNINPHAITLCCIGVSDGMGDISFRYHNIGDRPTLLSSKDGIQTPDEDVGSGGNSDDVINTHTDSNIGVADVEHTERDVVARKEITKSPKSVEHFDKESGNVIHTYDSSTEAATNFPGVTRVAVSLCCIGILEGVGGLGFRFSSLSEREIVDSYIGLWRKPTKVHQVSEEGGADIPSEQRKRSAPRSFESDYEELPRPRKRRSSDSKRSGLDHGRKEVTQYDVLTGEAIKVYASGSKAALALGLSQSNISQCCRGKSRTAGGFGFRFTSPQFNEDGMDEKLNDSDDNDNGNDNDNVDNNDESSSEEGDFDRDFVGPIGGGGGHILLQQAQISAVAPPSVLE